MKIEINALFEPLEIVIGNATVNTAIDVTADNLIKISEVCTKAKKEMDGVVVMEEKAKEEGDFKALERVNKKAAAIMKTAITAAIGQEDYEKIKDACGAGRKISDEACNVVMSRILVAIMETVAGQQQEIITEKAAHYLSEVENAQPKSDTEE